MCACAYVVGHLGGSMVKSATPTAFCWQAAVFMLNLNKYRDVAEYPTGKLYQAYMKVLEQLLKEVGGKILCRTEVFGQVVGTQDIDEVLGSWYPSHQAFLNLMTAPSSAKNMKLRDEAVAKADLHRCEDYTQS